MLMASKGPTYALQTLDLSGNGLEEVAHLHALVQLPHLLTLRLGKGSSSNPVCRSPDCRSSVFGLLQGLTALDGFGRNGADVPMPMLMPMPCLALHLQHLEVGMLTRYHNLVHDVIAARRCNAGRLWFERRESKYTGACRLAAVLGYLGNVDRYAGKVIPPTAATAATAAGWFDPCRKGKACRTTTVSTHRRGQHA